MGTSFAHQTFRAQRLGSPFRVPAAALLPREGGNQENVNAGQYYRPTIYAYAPTTSLRSCPSGSCWFVVEHFSGGVRWTNVMQIVKGIAPSAALSPARGRSRDNFGSEREQTIHAVECCQFDHRRPRMNSLTVIGHLIPTIRSRLSTRSGLGSAARHGAHIRSLPAVVTGVVLVRGRGASVVADECAIDRYALANA
jgi:hypothetical protein